MPYIDNEARSYAAQNRADLKELLKILVRNGTISREDAVNVFTERTDPMVLTDSGFQI